MLDTEHFRPHPGIAWKLLHWAITSDPMVSFTYFTIAATKHPLPYSTLLVNYHIYLNIRFEVFPNSSKEELDVTLE